MILNNRIRKHTRKHEHVSSNGKIENKDDIRNSYEKILRTGEGKLLNHLKSWLSITNFGEFCDDKIVKSNCAINEYLHKLQKKKDLSFFAEFENVLAAYSRDKRTADIKYMRQLLNNTWAVISDKSLLNVRISSKSESVLIYEIPLKNIREILTEPDHRIIHVVIYEDSNPSTSVDIYFKNNDVHNNAHFISSLVVAISISRKERNVYTNVTVVPSLFDIPSCQNMKKHLDGEPIHLEGFCLAHRLEISPSFREELMMQKGSEKYKPVVINLKGTSLYILAKAGQGGIPQEIFLINTSEISSFKRLDTPRPHSMLLIWKSITLNIAGSNECIIELLFDIINFSRRKPVVHALPEPAHIVITDMTVLLFSTEPTKFLLLRVPLLNISKAKTDEEDKMGGLYNLIINVDSLEADEAMLAFENLNNLQWCLSFRDETEMREYTNFFSRLVS